MLRVISPSSPMPRRTNLLPVTENSRAASNKRFRSPTLLTLKATLARPPLEAVVTSASMMRAFEGVPVKS